MRQINNDPIKPLLLDPADHIIHGVKPGSVEDISMSNKSDCDCTMLVWFVQPGQTITMDHEEYTGWLSPYKAAKDYYLDFWELSDEDTLRELGTFYIMVHDPASQCVFEYKSFIGPGNKNWMQNIPSVAARHGWNPV